MSLILGSMLVVNAGRTSRCATVLLTSSSRQLAKQIRVKNLQLRQIATSSLLAQKDASFTSAKVAGDRVKPDTGTDAPVTPKENAAFQKYEAAASTEPDHFSSAIQHKVDAKNQHFKAEQNKAMSVGEDYGQDYLQPHPIWSQEEVQGIEITHRPPKNMTDKLAYYTVLALRKSFDLCSGYTIGRSIGVIDERAVLIRCIFLETVAGVPGFAAAMIRHLHSLRRMQRDHGWIHTLLEEAENERMHLMTFLQLRKPGPVFRAAVIFAQWSFTAFFSVAYLISPRYCHRFVGYLEEQAVITYTHILEEMDSGGLPMWRRLPAPEIAKTYWQLEDDAMMRDVILAIRADEAHHRHVNHTLSSMKLRQKNPFKPGE